MKKIILFTLFAFFAFVATAQLAHSPSKGSTYRVSKKSINIFPNPVIDFIMLKDKYNEVAEIHLYNIVGKKMATFTVEEGEKYYVSNLPKGMYLVQMLDEKNKILSTQRLSIRRP